MACNLLEIQDVALKVAVSGEGGVERSTLAGTLACLRATDHLKALAIDADPDVNSASALGLRSELRASVHTIAEGRKLIEARRGARVREFAQIFMLDCKEPGITEHYAQDAPARSSLCSELPSALAAIVLARKVLSTSPCLVRKGDEVVILDMEAGTEHLSRGTARDVDLMLAVHKPGERSVETAQRIRKRSANLGIRSFAMMLSR